LLINSFIAIKANKYITGWILPIKNIQNNDKPANFKIKINPSPQIPANPVPVPHPLIFSGPVSAEIYTVNAASPKPLPKPINIVASTANQNPASRLVNKTDNAIPINPMEKHVVVIIILDFYV